MSAQVSPERPRSKRPTLDKLNLSASTGHKDSVTCAVFNHDSSLVASGDMSGVIKVWKMETKEEIWSFEVGDLEVEDTRAHSC